MTQILLTQLKPAHSPNWKQSVNSEPNWLSGFYLEESLTSNGSKYKSHDNNYRMFADTKVLKTKYTETRVLKKHKRFYAEKNIATLKDICKESLKNIKVEQKSYCFINY